jgi:hypothetical protein
MTKFHIRIINGWCGNRMVIVRDYLADLLTQRNFDVKIDNQSIWENSSAPEHVDLVFQLIQAFSPDELSCPSLPIRPLLKDLNHQETIEQVLKIVEEHYPVQVSVSA